MKKEELKDMLPKWSWEKIYKELNAHFQKQNTLDEKPYERLKRLRHEMDQAESDYKKEYQKLIGESPNLSTVQVIQDVNDKFVYELNGVQIEVRKAPDGTCLVNADDFWKATGHKQSFTEYLSTDEGLDALNTYKKRTGESAFNNLIYKAD